MNKNLLLCWMPAGQAPFGFGAAIIAWALVLACALVLQSPPAAAGYYEQGAKLVGTGNTGPAEQGWSVSLSADGNTLIVGGLYDNAVTPCGNCIPYYVGAAWIFTRSDGVWTQQQPKLVGSSAAFITYEGGGQGTSVAMSGDGFTALVGGPNDGAPFQNNATIALGAAWVWTRNGDVWSQQAKLVDSTASSSTVFYGLGASVALSFDGNTALVGEQQSNNGVGGAWVFTRNGSTWNQGKWLTDPNASSNSSSLGSSVALSSDGLTAILGDLYRNTALVFARSSGGNWILKARLVPADSSGESSFYFGQSVALSGIGQTALVGGNFDNYGVGATWVFTLSAGSWDQLGSKLVGSGGSDAPQQGFSVALSDDGSVALEGGPADINYIGSAWVFTRPIGLGIGTGAFMPNGLKLPHGEGFQGTNPNQGWSVALSADGSTAVVGAPYDNADAGAVWVYVRTIPRSSHDINGDGKSDIMWHQTGQSPAQASAPSPSNTFAGWLMNGSQLLQSGSVATIPTAWSLVGQHDFNGDGQSDFLWRDVSGNLAIWLMNGLTISSTASLGNIPTGWTVIGTGDFSGDGYGDILWTDGSGNVAIWFMNGTQVVVSAVVGNIPTTWSVVATGDFNGDGKTDILWRDTGGNTAVWLMSGTQLLASAALGTIPLSWSVAATGDFDGNGTTDILWHDSSGNTAVWLMNGTQVAATTGVGNIPTTWAVIETGDFNSDGKSDILWRDSSGNTAIWFMNGAQISSSASLGDIPTTWTIDSMHAN